MSNVWEILAKCSPGAGDAIVLTFRLSMADLRANPKFPIDADLEHPVVCDWFEADLVDQLAETMSTPFYCTEPSERTGERLSLRIVFPGLDRGALANALANFPRDWWEILERRTYRDIYGTSYLTKYPPSDEQALDPPVKVTLEPFRLVSCPL